MEILGNKYTNNYNVKTNKQMKDKDAVGIKDRGVPCSRDLVTTACRLRKVFTL